MGAPDPRAWWHATQAAICDRIEPVAHGTLVRAADFPTYYDFNLLRVGASAASAAEIAAEADRVLEGLEHRKVELDDEATGRRLRADFEALGWRAERIAWLTSSDPALKAAPSGIEVGVADRDEVLALRREWNEHWTAEQIAAFIGVEAAVGRQLGTRLVAARRDGAAVGFVQWRVAGGVAEIMLAYVTPGERGGGTGAAMIAAAVQAARAEGAQGFVIAADDERDAKRLYERLGFRTAWVMHEFTRAPAGG